MSDQVYLKIYKDNHVTFIGSWNPANELNNNFSNQQDLGWHIFMGLFQGADKIEVQIGDLQKAHKEYTESLK